jgi:outer membrane protein TolC
VWLPGKGKIKMKRSIGTGWSGTALTLLLSACSLAPPLKTPVVPAPDAYKEIGPWTQAQPADRLPRDSWWALYGNPELDDLEKRLIAGNPTLAAALANYAQARALADQARAGLFPTLGLNASAQRNRESLNAPNSTCGGKFATRSPRARPTPPPQPRTSRTRVSR